MMNTMFQGNGAIFSKDRMYRYLLWRGTWVGSELYANGAHQTKILWLLINPSDADETKSDATLRKVLGFSGRWGFGKAIIANPFAYVSKDVDVFAALAKVHSGVIGPDNDFYIDLAIAEADTVVVGWSKYGNMQSRDVALLEKLVNAGKQPMCLQVNKDGSPAHPLMLSYSLPLKPYIWG